MVVRSNKMLQIICRTCLALDGEFSSIYDSKGSNCVADMVGHITSHTPKKSDGMPQMVCLACIQEIKRFCLFKIKCLNSESVLKQLLYSCQDTSLEKNVDVARECTLPKEQADIPDVPDEKAFGEPYIVIDLNDENERLEIKHEVEKQKQFHYNNEGDENAAKAGILLEENENVKLLLHVEHVNMSKPIEEIDTPDIEFVETAKESYDVVDSDEESSYFAIEHEAKNHGELLPCNEDSTPIEIERNPEATKDIHPQVDSPDVEFVENDKVPCVVIDSEDEIEHMETENEVAKDVNSTLSNEENENVAIPNTLMEGKPSADTTGCILPQEQDGTQDIDVVKAEEEPYVVIDLECESERLEIKHEVQKHLQLLYSNKGNENVANADVPIEEMRNVEPKACVPPQVDELHVEIVEPNKEMYIVVDSEDETVQFEIEHDVKEHSTPNIRQYLSLLKAKNKLKPSFPMIQSVEENSTVSEVNRPTQHSKISDDFSQIFDYFDAGDEAESDQECSVDFAPPARKLQCTKCAMKFLNPTNLREHMFYCEISRQDKSTKEQSPSPPIEIYISNSGNVDSASDSDETNMTKNYVNNEANMHKCPVCQECFAMRLLLTHHMRLHSSGSIYCCSICKRGFTTKSSLNDHTLRHHENKRNKCEECSLSFYSVKELRLHVRSHTGDSPFVCELCQPSSKSDKDLDSDRKENKLIQVKDESDTNEIIDVVGLDDDTACSSSIQMNDNGELDEQANDNVRQLYMQAHRCSHCGAGFEKRKSLEIHINQFKCSTPPFVCCQCKCQSLSYPKNDNCPVDMPTCDICNVVLPNGEDLLKHNLETHKVNSQSAISKKNLQTMSAVKVRMRRLQIEEPYVCPVCGNAFASRECLSQHMLQHRTAKPFNSGKCPHFRRHTGDLPYACPLCPKRFAAWSGCRPYQQKHKGPLTRTKSCNVEMQDDSAEEPTAERVDVDKDDAVSDRWK